MFLNELTYSHLNLFKLQSRSCVSYFLHTLYLCNVYFLIPFQYLSSLQLIVQWYNQLKQTVLEVELPLIRTKLESVDLQLSRAESDLTWLDPDCSSFINATKDQVQNLVCRVTRAKENCEAIQSMMKKWSKQAMFCRKDNKRGSLIQLEDREDRVNKKFSSMTKDGELIHELLQVRLTSVIHC